MAQTGVEGILWAFQTLKWNWAALSSAQEQALSPRDDISLAPVTWESKKGTQFPKASHSEVLQGSERNTVLFI